MLCREMQRGKELPKTNKSCLVLTARYFAAKIYATKPSVAKSHPFHHPQFTVLTYLPIGTDLGDTEYAVFEVAGCSGCLG